MRPFLKILITDIDGDTLENIDSDKYIHGNIDEHLGKKISGFSCFEDEIWIMIINVLAFLEMLIYIKTLFDININKNIKKRKFKNIDIEKPIWKILILIVGYQY